MDKFKSHLKKYSEMHPAELPEGHRNRFLEKLTGSTERKRRKIRNLAWAAAGVAASALIAVFFSGEPGNSHMPRELPMLGEASFEMGQPERFFVHRIDELKADEFPDEPLLQRHLENLHRLELEYESLRKTMARNLGDERVIDAMIQNYKMRIAVLESMRQTQILLQTNKARHESKS